MKYSDHKDLVTSHWKAINLYSRMYREGTFYFWIRTVLSVWLGKTEKLITWSSFELGDFILWLMSYTMIFCDFFKNIWLDHQLLINAFLEDYDYHLSALKRDFLLCIALACHRTVFWRWFNLGLKGRVPSTEWPASCWAVQLFFFGTITYLLEKLDSASMKDLTGSYYPVELLLF